MSYITGQNRGQITLFPKTIDEYILQDNPVQVIDVFIENLDLDKASFKRTKPSKDGRPAYSPKDLLKLYVYGYFNKIRSSRKLMVECRRNVELMWLLKKLAPDFRTIADFRKENAKALKNVFKAFVKLCLDMNLYAKELIAIDGSKFRAVNSKDNNFTLSKLTDRLNRIDEHISQYIKELDSSDKKEENSTQYTKEEIQNKIDELNKNKVLYNSYLDEMAENNTTQKSTTDPESRLMKNNGKLDVCYNVQTAVDSKSHLIADFTVTNNCNDLGLLTSMALTAKEALETKTLEVVADKGYRKQEDILECIQNGIIPNVHLLDGEDNYTFIIDYEENQLTKEIINSTKPGDIKKCIESGILPNIYVGSTINVEIIEPSDLSLEVKDVSEEVLDSKETSIIETDNEEDIEEEIKVNENFVRDKLTNTVTCPMGYKFKQKAIVGGKTRYVNKAACLSCKCKCTTSTYKLVAFSPDQDIAKSRAFTGKTSVIIKIKTLKPVSESKKKQKPKSVNYSTKMISITFVPDKYKLKLRKTIVEHPFGTIKRWCDGSYLLLKGKIKATADLSLSFLAYNMKRAINMVGINAIIAKIQAA
ncbi:transposase [Carnobacterium alterfunditum]|uniref:transposase n=1 Tax=Carnobacterium alterfunditum TaxID=28230 RepID=UPI0035943928